MAGEGDQTKWRGIRPVSPAENIPVDLKATVDMPIIPATPEQVFTRYEVPQGTTYVEAWGSGNNTLITVYTTPSDKMFYLCTLIFSLRTTANDVAECWIYNDTPAIHMHLLGPRVLANDGKCFTICPNIAIKVPEAYSVRCRSYNAGCAAICYVNGYLRDV